MSHFRRARRARRPHPPLHEPRRPLPQPQAFLQRCPNVDNILYCIDKKQDEVDCEKKKERTPEAPTVVTVIGVNPTSSSKTSDITSDDAPVPKSRSDISAVGAGIGIPLVILAVAGAAYFCCWRRPKSKSTDFSTYTGSTTGPTQVVPTAASIPLNSLRSGHSSGPASQWGLGMSHSTTQVPTTAASVPRNSVRSGHSSGPASRRSGMSNSQSGRDIDPRDSRSPAPTEPTPYSRIYDVRGPVFH